MKNKKSLRLRVPMLVLAGLTLSACAHWHGTYYYNNAVFAGFDPLSIAGEQPVPVTLDVGYTPVTPEDTTAHTPGVDAPTRRCASPP